MNGQWLASSEMSLRSPEGWQTHAKLAAREAQANQDLTGAIANGPWSPTPEPALPGMGRGNQYPSRPREVCILFYKSGVQQYARCIAGPTSTSLPHLGGGGTADNTKTTDSFSKKKIFGVFLPTNYAFYTHSWVVNYVLCPSFSGRHGTFQKLFLQPRIVQNVNIPKKGNLSGLDSHVNRPGACP